MPFYIVPNEPDLTADAGHQYDHLKPTGGPFPTREAAVDWTHGLRTLAVVERDVPKRTYQDTRPSRTLEFFADAPEGELGERVELIAAQEGEHYVLTVRINGSDAFQLDTTNAMQEHVVREAAELFRYAASQGSAQRVGSPTPAVRPLDLGQFRKGR